VRPERHAEGADLLAHAHRVSFEAASVEDERGRSQFEDGAPGSLKRTRLRSLQAASKLSHLLLMPAFQL
jgi:hypothetical protein